MSQDRHVRTMLPIPDRPVTAGGERMLYTFNHPDERLRIAMARR